MITSKTEMRNDDLKDAQRIYLGLGSNLGEREANLSRARRAVADLGLTQTRASSIYETEPVGFADQPWFLNQVIETAIAPEIEAKELLECLLRVESDMGRRRSVKDSPVKDGPRLIDIDLLLYGDLILTQAKIVLPHPRMHMRRFVLEPMAEIAPDLKHPAIGKSMAELLDALEDSSVVRIYRSEL